MSELWRPLVLGCLLVVASAAPAFAQAEQGDKEVLLNGDVTTAFGGDSTTTATTGNVSGGLGYYFTQAIEVFGASRMPGSSTTCSATWPSTST